MSEINIIIDAVELTPNPVKVGGQLIIAVTVLPKIYSIETESGFPLMTADGYLIERTD